MKMQPSLERALNGRRYSGPSGRKSEAEIRNSKEARTTEIPTRKRLPAATGPAPVEKKDTLEATLLGHQTSPGLLFDADRLVDLRNSSPSGRLLSSPGNPANVHVALGCWEAIEIAQARTSLDRDSLRSGGTSSGFCLRRRCPTCRVLPRQ